MIYQGSSKNVPSEIFKNAAYQVIRRVTTLRIQSVSI